MSLFPDAHGECRFCTAAMLATRAASRAHSALHRARPADCGRPMRPSVRGRRLIGRRHRRVLPAAAWLRNAGVPALPMMSGWCRRPDKADGLKSERRGNMPSSPPKGCSHTDLIAFQHMLCTLVAATIAASLTTRVRRRAWRFEAASRRSDEYATQTNGRTMSGGESGARWRR